PIVTEDGPHDVQFHGYQFLELAPDARLWASAWPRCAESIGRRVYLSRDARFATREDLAAAIASAAQDQKWTALRDILLTLGVPTDPPPDSLPEALYAFAEMWKGLRLDDITPVDELLEAATRWNGPAQLAIEVLARRSDLLDLAAKRLQSSDNDQRRHGRFLVNQFGVLSVEIMDAIRSRLRLLVSNDSGEMSEICRLLMKLGA